MIKKALNDSLTLIKDSRFPRTHKVSTKPYRATIGIGGNIGDVVRRFHHLVHFLEKDPFIDVMQTSRLLKNPPFGFTQQADFINSVMVVATTLRPEPLLRHLLRIEKRFGRRRSFENAPRTLDLDLLFYEQEKIQSKCLTLPHPAWSERLSVLIPLSYLGQQR